MKPFCIGWIVGAILCGYIFHVRISELERAQVKMENSGDITTIWATNKTGATIRVNFFK